MSLASNKAIQKELLKRHKASHEAFDIKNHLFAQQLAFVEDTASNKIALCSRRSGKTIACAADLVDTALKTPDIVCLYITLSRNNAKKIIWKELEKLNRIYKLGAKKNLSELSFTFPNHSVIYLSGAKDSSEVEKFRGFALKKVYIDEAQSFRSYIKDLINDVLSPALMDHAGTLVLIGTPGPVPTGYFYEAARNGSNWSRHGWTFFDNPFLLKTSKSTHEQMLERELTRRGVTKEDPSIQREYFGRWVTDTNSLLLKYDASLNNFDRIPEIKPREYNYIMGIDVGFKDADAIAILAYEDNSPVIYLVEEMIVKKQGITELVEQIQMLQRKYDVDKLVIDQGGLGLKIAEEMRRRHGIAVQGADKARKMENIEFLNDALRTNRFKAKPTSRFAVDSYLVEIDWDKSKPDKIKVSESYHSDIIDAVLYAFKESPAFAYKAPQHKLQPGTRAYYAAIEDEMFEAELEYMLRQQQEREESDF